MPGVRADVVAITIVHVRKTCGDLRTPNHGIALWLAFNIAEIVAGDEGMLSSVGSDFRIGWCCMDAQESDAEEAEELE